MFKITKSQKDTCTLMQKENFVQYFEHTYTFECSVHSVLVASHVNVVCTSKTQASMKGNTLKYYYLTYVKEKIAFCSLLQLFFAYYKK